MESIKYISEPDKISFCTHYWVLFGYIYSVFQVVSLLAVLVHPSHRFYRHRLSMLLGVTERLIPASPLPSRCILKSIVYIRVCDFCVVLNLLFFLVGI